MPTIKTPISRINADLATTPATTALNITNQTGFDACRAIKVSTAASYVLYYADAPTTAITEYLEAGLLYPFSIVKATAVGGGAIGANVFHVYY